MSSQSYRLKRKLVADEFTPFNPNQKKRKLAFWQNRDFISIRKGANWLHEQISSIFPKSHTLCMTKPSDSQAGVLGLYYNDLNVQE